MFTSQFSGYSRCGRRLPSAAQRMADRPSPLPSTSRDLTPNPAAIRVA
jgi:hypothetical protein